MILSRGTSLQLPPFDGGVKAGRTLAPRAETFDDVAREHILEVLRETTASWRALAAQRRVWA